MQRNSELYTVLHDSLSITVSKWTLCVFFGQPESITASVTQTAVHFCGYEDKWRCLTKTPTYLSSFL